MTDRQARQQGIGGELYVIFGKFYIQFMSRIGKKGIVLPDKVKVNLEGQKISVEGPKGNLSRILPSLVCCTLDQTKQQIIIEKAQETKLSQALFGLSRTLVANMVTGVSVGFEKRLQITEVGIELNSMEKI